MPHHESKSIASKSNRNHHKAGKKISRKGRYHQKHHSNGNKIPIARKEKNNYSPDYRPETEKRLYYSD